MSYTYTTDAYSDNWIIRASDNAWIPVDADNVDYQEYLAWVADGNTASTSTLSSPSVQTPDSEVMFTMEVI